MMSTMDSLAISAIASPRRREILRLVWDRELPAGAIAEEFDISWPAISQHMGVLKEAGLIAERRDGRRRFYRADAETVGALGPVLTQMWNDDLDRLVGLAEAERPEGAH